MLISPLRYPGGKQNLADHFEAVLRDNLLNGCVLYEPYAGGGSITLSRLSRELISKAVLIEKDPLLFAFWKCVFEHSESLCDKIQKAQVTVSTWKNLQCYKDADAFKKYDLLDLGFAGLFFNRTNFSGIMNANPIGGMKQQSKYTIDCRFNKARIIELILKISRYAKEVEVVYGDAVQVLNRRKRRLNRDNVLVYVDPPYYEQGGRLYRYHYNFEGHRQLAEFIDQQTYPWIVSIDNHPAILELYEGQVIVPILFNYVVKQSKKVEELLISNMPLSSIMSDEDAKVIIAEANARRGIV